MPSSKVVLCSAARTAIGTYNGALKDVSAPDLGAVAIGASIERAKIKGTDIGTVIMGQVVQAGAKMNPARQAAIKAGIPVEVPAMAVNRVCGSGAQAIATAAQEVMLGFVDSAIAGGMENMDQSPYLMSGGRWGYRMGDAQIYDSMLRDGLNDAFCDKHSGWVTEDLVSKFQLTREAQDRWACRSQTSFSKAQAAGKFQAEIAPVEIPSRKGPSVFARDEHNRPDTTLESLAKLKPAFRKDGTVTAGNAPGLNSGAAAMIVADAGWAEKHGLAAMARLVAYGVGAVEPGMFGLGCESACKKDPLLGVIGIQSGPPNRWVHIGFHDSWEPDWDVDRGDNCEDSSGVFRTGEGNKSDLSGSWCISEGREEGDPLGLDGVSLPPRRSTSPQDWPMARRARSVAVGQ